MKEYQVESYSCGLRTRYLECHLNDCAAVGWEIISVTYSNAESLERGEDTFLVVMARTKTSEKEEG